MKQKEFENLSKDELFEKIKAEYAKKAKDDFVTCIFFGLLCLATIVANVYAGVFSFSWVLLFVIFLVITLEKVLSYLLAKGIMRAKNAEELLSRYDAYTTYTKKIGKWRPVIAAPALFLIGYVIYNMLTEINIERFGVILFWLIIAFLVLSFILVFILLLVMIILTKGKAMDVGLKDSAVERLRELVEKEKQDTL